MKIKGPGSYQGPPTPPESTSGAEKSKFQPDQHVETESTAHSARTKQRASEPSSFEKGLQQLAGEVKTQGLQGEAKVGRVVDMVLEEMLGKDFLSRPDAAAVKQAITPLISQDERLMGKLNSILSRLEKQRS